MPHTLKAVVEVIEGEEFDRVVAHGFLTDEGVESEIEALEERFDREYDSVEYNEASNPKLYFDGTTFSRTYTGAVDRASRERPQL